ncbi:SRPBCC family protein [Actinoplanes awajinensis]|nr:SRPBCC family protein [Actinoplanes awajinensis]
MARIYVETIIAAPMERIWAATQDHRQHPRWDARFGRIDPVPGSEPAAFTYATAVLPGVEIAGYGVHSGERQRDGGEAVSSLRFGSADRRSPIREGAGYWRYVPVAGGVRFLTGYAYRTRWGRAGRLVDLAFGPVFGWATAWSFDRLRLWLEHGVTPERARRNAVVECLLRAALVAAAPAAGRPLLVLVAAGLAIGFPPYRKTPAARRCRRRPGKDGPR